MCYAHSAFEHSLNSLQNSKGQDAELQGSGSDSLQELQGSGLQGPRSEARLVPQIVVFMDKIC